MIAAILVDGVLAPLTGLAMAAALAVVAMAACSVLSWRGRRRGDGDGEP